MPGAIGKPMFSFGSLVDLNSLISALMPGDLAHYAPSFYCSLLVPGYQTFMHKMEASGRPSKILDLQIFDPAESTLSKCREALE
jgi:hypothetical protein